VRRCLAAVAIGCVLTLVACSSSASTDRALAGNRNPVVSPPRLEVQPVVGDCYTVLVPDVSASERVPCSEHHLVEVAHIGTFVGNAAALAGPPIANTPAMRDAYTECARPTAAYLGGDWHEALMELELIVPDGDDWHNGARWFRCQLFGMPSLDYTQLAGADESFRGVLAKPSALSVRCITWLGGPEFGKSFEPVPCASPHRGEYAGSYTAPPGPWPATVERERALAAHGCEAIVARFVGFPSWRQFDNPAIGYYQLGFQQPQWDMGDRSVRCYASAYTKDGRFVGSVKGIKSRPPKG
jgi:Septum formation